MGGTHTVAQGLGRPVSRRGLLLWLAVAWAWVLVAAVPAAAQAAGCVVTFRHGDVVRADWCEDAGVAVAYVRFGGWVVIPKAALVSVADETGVTRFSAAWTPAETRAQIQALPTEGGVPIGPTSAEMPPAFASQPPQVIYVPSPTPESPPPVYEVAAPYYGYPAPVVVCRHCARRHPGGVRPPFVRGVHTNPSSMAPMTVQKSPPPMSRIR
jgi:hypothetical protein